MPGIHTHPQTTFPHQAQAVWGSTLGNSSTSSLTLMVKATWRGPLLPTSQTRFTLLQARAARELSVMSVFCKTETAEWDEGRSGGSWGEGTASEGEKSAEKAGCACREPRRGRETSHLPLHRAICTAGPSSLNVLSEAIMHQR